MGQQIIKQPNGKYAVFSSITDTIIVWDATEEEVVDHFAEQAEADARTHAWVLMEHVRADRAEDAYFQFAMTWQEALELDQDNGGNVKSDYALEQDGPSEWVDLSLPAADMPEWARHLADDAPLQRCGACGRATWSTEDFGQPCGMRQPDGRECTGVFAA